MIPHEAGSFFLLIKTLPAFWADQLFVLMISVFGKFWYSRLPDVQPGGGFQTVRSALFCSEVGVRGFTYEPGYDKFLHFWADDEKGTKQCQAGVGSLQVA